MTSLKAAGWTLAGYRTADGHTAEATRGDGRVAVTARSSETAWLAP